MSSSSAPSSSAPSGSPPPTRARRQGLYLHPFHCSSSSGEQVTPLSWSQFCSGEISRRATDENDIQGDNPPCTVGVAAVQAAASMHIGDRCSPRFRVRVRSQCIEVADTASNFKIEVPILLSEVAYAHDDSDSIIIAVVPCPLHLPNSPGTKRWEKPSRHETEDPLRQHLLDNSNTESGLKREMWLFILDDVGYISHLLEWMGSRGAIRTDLCEEYTLDRLLGKGAAANVYQGSHLRRESLHDTAAVKVLFGTGGRAEDMLVHEVSMLSKAQGSRHVCKLYSVFGGAVESTADSSAGESTAREDSPAGAQLRCEHYWALSFELCICDVYAQIRQQGALSEDATGNHICQALSGLAYIHKKHVIHRDIKASNILVAQSGLTLLADFGIAALDSDLVALACACGTPGFLGPEVLRTKTCDCKTDVFGLGASCFHMLCGRVPFTSSEGVKDILRLNASCKIPLDVLVASNCSDECLDVATKLMARKPSQRPSALDALEYPWVQQFRRSLQGSSRQNSIAEAPSKGENEPQSVAVCTPDSGASVAQGSIVRWIKSQKASNVENEEGKPEDEVDVKKNDDDQQAREVGAQSSKSSSSQPAASPASQEQESPMPENGDVQENSPHTDDLLLASREEEPEGEQKVVAHDVKPGHADEDPALNPSSVNDAIPIPCMLECEGGKQRFKSLRQVHGPLDVANEEDDDDWETWRSSSFSCSSVGSSRRSARSRQSSCNSNSSRSSGSAGSDQSDLCLLPQRQNSSLSNSNGSDIQLVTPATNTQRGQNFRRSMYSQQKRESPQNTPPEKKDAPAGSQHDQAVDNQARLQRHENGSKKSNKYAVSDQPADEVSVSVESIVAGSSPSAPSGSNPASANASHLEADASPASAASVPSSSQPDERKQAGYSVVEPPKIPRVPAAERGVSSPASSEATPTVRRPGRGFLRRVSDRVSGLRNWALRR